MTPSPGAESLHPPQEHWIASSKPAKVGKASRKNVPSYAVVQIGINMHCFFCLNDNLSDWI
jgi:hypothetical protein